ncbi:MAG: lysozyme inhibitor LprI family protein [Neisseriaceae bacterium]
MKFYKVIIWFLSLGLISSIVNAACLNHIECIKACPQIVLSKTLAPGTDVQCKDAWNLFVKAQAYDALSLMTINGLGGQKVNLKKALEYAKQAAKTESFTIIQNPEALVNYIQSMIDHNEMKKLSICDGGSDNVLPSNTNNMFWCSNIAYSDYINSLRLINKKMVVKFESIEINALNDTLTKYLTFIDADNDFRFSIGQFQGSGRYIWGLNSKHIMLDFYKHAIDNLFLHYPKKFKIKMSRVLLDTQLNNNYNKLIVLTHKIPNNYNYPWSNKKSKTDLQLQQAQRNWILFRDSYVNFAQMYYAYKFNKNDIRDVTTAYLTQRRIAELKDEQNTLLGNLKEGWFNNPW